MTSPETDGLAITELVSRTGIPAPTLRSWESRFGQPRPQRLPGGHRRYTERDVDFVNRVVRLRETGLGLAAAIDRASAHNDDQEPSIFAGLRRRHAELAPQALSKATVLALTKAIEDECCARADRPVLFGLFQDAGFLRKSQQRWKELARTASVTVVFADFGAGDPDGVAGRDLLAVDIPENVPLRREWAVVCESADQPACISAWEHPGQDDVPDAERLFEAVWSVDPQVVRDAAQICANLASAYAPAHADCMATAFTGQPAAASSDLGRASGLLNRMVAYVEQSRT